jgi:hypothetical protein
MSTLTAPVIDKSSWGDGPWQTEPDRVEWEHAGLPCLAKRNHHGVWCGYAAVAPGHPWYAADYDVPDVDVHGGLTYADRCQGSICHVPKPGTPDDVWWFGFDCGHAFDFSPGMAARLRSIGHDDTILGEVYRPLSYAQAETNRLAEQLAHHSTPVSAPR